MPKYAELRRLLRKEKHTQALTACAALRKLVPDDDDLAKCEVVCLIQLNQFEDGLAAAQKYGGAGAFAFEAAYCLYRLNRLDDALAACRDAAEPARSSASVLNLEAQLAYRLRRFGEASALYERLIAGAGGDDHAPSDELLANACAAFTAAGQGEDVLEILPPGAVADADDTGAGGYELLYNVGCAQLAAGRPADACDTLRRAEGACRRSLAADEASATEIAEEVAIVITQRACALHMHARPRERRGGRRARRRRRRRGRRRGVVQGQHRAVSPGEVTKTPHWHCCSGLTLFLAFAVHLAALAGPEADLAVWVFLRVAKTR